MDTENAVVALCIKGTQAEFAGRLEEARALYWRAWEAARDDFEACVAAHYVARHQPRPEDALHWNQVALRHAMAVGDARVESLYPSLYVNLGHAYEVLGRETEARHYYALAAELGLVHRDDSNA
jgi:tetratricopeptide (TPR) repeat protein